MTLEEAQASIGVSVRDGQKLRNGVIQSVNGEEGSAIVKAAFSAAWLAPVADLERVARAEPAS